MRNIQICPWCGEEIIEVDFESEPGKYYEKRKNSNNDDSYDLVLCKNCHNIIYDNNRTLWKKISIPLYIIFALLSLRYIIPAFKLAEKYSILDNEFLGNIFILILILPIVIVMSIIYDDLVKNRNPGIQRYIQYDIERRPIIRKAMFCAKIDFNISFKIDSRSREFVKNNIFKITANGKSAYIILTKADFRKCICEATFPALKKENGLVLLEKHSEFEISNGENVLGTLKIEKVFEN